MLFLEPVIVLPVDQVNAIRTFWNWVLSGFDHIYLIIQGSLLAQLCFLVSLIGAGVTLVKFFKNEEDNDK